MIAAAIVCAAAISQAATVSWQSGTTTTAGLPEGTAISGITYNFFEITAAAFASYGDDMAAVYADKDNLGKVIASGTTKGNGKANISDGDATGWAASSAHYVAVIAETEGEDGATYWIANTLDASVGADNTTTFNNYATNLHGTGGSALSWTAVPEPTSGLLRLLGVAGLALKRKRA